MIVVELSERFEVLRRLLPQHLHDDAMIQRLADQSCEIEFPKGTVFVHDGQPVAETYVVIAGRAEVRQRSGRRWLAFEGAIIDAIEGAVDEPVRMGASGVSVVACAALAPTAVLAVPMLRCPTRVEPDLLR